MLLSDNTSSAILFARSLPTEKWGSQVESLLAWNWMEPLTAGTGSTVLFPRNCVCRELLDQVADVSHVPNCALIQRLPAQNLQSYKVAGSLWGEES